MSNTILDSGFAIVKKTRYGYMLFNKYDTYIGRSFDLYGEFSQLEVELFLQILKPGMCVLDVGANIGAFATIFAEQVGVSGSVHAFEPQKQVFQTLCANIAINSIENVYTYNKCVGKDNKKLLMPNLSQYITNNFGGISAKNAEDNSGFLVETMTIDEMALERCDFIKVDVEGMEEDVLRGADKTIRKFRPIMYLENDRKEKSEALIKAVKKLEYKVYGHTPPLYNKNNFYAQRVNVFGNIVSKNILCIHAKNDIKIDGFIEL